MLWLEILSLLLGLWPTSQLPLLPLTVVTSTNGPPKPGASHTSSLSILTATSRCWLSKPNAQLRNMRSLVSHSHGLEFTPSDARHQNPTPSRAPGHGDRRVYWVLWYWRSEGDPQLGKAWRGHLRMGNLQWSNFVLFIPCLSSIAGPVAFESSFFHGSWTAQSTW